MTNKNRIVPLTSAGTAYHKTTLPNGIRIVTESIPYVKSASFGVWLGVGSRDESPENNGISHFLEHMTFKGTRKRSVQQIARSLESVGGYLNAFTTKEHTCYYARVLDEHTELAIDVLADLVQHSTFPVKEIEKEKQVVIEEIKSLEDDPDDLIHDFFEEDVFSGHPLGLPVIGTVENVASFTRDQLQQFTSSHYRPESTVIAGAGNIQHDQVVEFVSKYFQPAAGKRQTMPAAKFPKRTRNIIHYDRPIQQAHICTGTLAFSVHSKKRFAALALNTLLGDGMSSRLFQNVREKYGFAYSVYSFLNFLSDTGTFGVYIATDNKHIDRSLHLIFAELEKLKKTSVKSGELQRTKAQLKGNTMLGLESTSNRMMRLGTGELYFESFIELDELLAKVDAIKMEELEEVADILFDENKFSTIVIKGENAGRA
ncbi:MAG: pitrilysin family protein [Ignavibacteriales bacterium]|nr:pitrilysin family protein [Ignavibacteriales bacterium]